MPNVKLTERQRVEVRMQMGRVDRRVLAARYGVSERTIRRAFNPEVPEVKERHRIRARQLYWEGKESSNIPTVTYRARGCGDGRESRCRRCKRILKPEDFTTDLITGTLIETTVCVRCKG